MILFSKVEFVSCKAKHVRGKFTNTPLFDFLFRSLHTCTANLAATTAVVAVVLPPAKVVVVIPPAKS
eukprot:3285417-Amphidinium_carterae.1